MFYCGYSVFLSVPVQCFENKQLYFAKRLNEAMKVVTQCCSLSSCSKVAILRARLFFLLLLVFFWFFLEEERRTSACESAIFCCGNTESKVGRSYLTAVLHQLLLELSLDRVQLE